VPVRVVLTEALSNKAASLASLRDQVLQLMASGAGTTAGPQHRRRQQRRLTAAEVAELDEQYQAGRSMNELARRYGVHRTNILHALERSEIPIRQRGLFPDRVAEAAVLYRAGWSLARLGEKYGCKDMTVAHALRQHGVEIRPRRGWRY
jgi:lambda repressor-like predicted transcriptional regulator